MDEEVKEVVGTPKVKRDEWEIKDDLRAIKRTIAIFKDKERLEEVQEMIKSNKESEKALELVGEGDLARALGL